MKNLGNEGGIGLVFTALMILLFLGSVRATFAFFSRFRSPLWRHSSAFNMGGGSINTMVLAGLALAFSRLIDNSVVVLENIFRHHGDGRIARSCVGEGRKGSAVGSARRNLYHRHRFLPGRHARTE